MTLMSAFEPVIQHRRELKPLPVEVQPKLSQMHDIRVVLLDVYGTLVVSGSGEVGTAAENPTDASSRESENASDMETEAIGDRLIGEAVAATGLDLSGPIPTQTELQNQITHWNSSRHSDQNPKPEVEILDVWRSLWSDSGRTDVANNPQLITRIACELEARTNPTWPMPGASEALSHFRNLGLRLGIVSNAQAYTIPLVEDLVGDDLGSIFDLNLCFFSNRFLAAKPGPRMFDRTLAELNRLEIHPHQAVYIGNDVLNDVWAAKQAGLRTALFAGDGRSLRLRENHPACQNLSSDIVLTRWNQVVECFDQMS